MQSKVDGREEIRHPRSRRLSPSSCRTPFSLSGRSKIEASTFELTCRKPPVERHTGDGKHRVACGESDRSLSQPGVAKPRVAATLKSESLAADRC